MSALRNYLLVTAAYWVFTLTDGALRMLVLLHFHGLGYTPVQLASLFVFYEVFGVVTNLLGGWIASHMGLRITLLGGLALQVVALVMLSALAPEWSRGLSVAYVMAAQALSGIAKDLTKMSSKSAIKILVPGEAASALFRWVALLTGSKNALKGAGFFLGGLLLSLIGFRPALWAMAAGLLLMLVLAVVRLPAEMGRAKHKSKLTRLLAKQRDINVLSAARFFLFGARDIWFVVGVPIFLAQELGWGFTQVGTFLALWVIGYGVIQAGAPAMLKAFTQGQAPRARSAQLLALALAMATALVPMALSAGVAPATAVLAGLGLFGVVFAVSSAVHSYLILAYSNADKVALDVGFYYMANAGGRLVGTLLSGLVYAWSGLPGCLWASAIFALASAAVALGLRDPSSPLALSQVKLEAGE